MRRGLLAFAAAVVLAATAMVGAQVPPPDSVPAFGVEDESTDLYFVELASPPTADGTSLATVRNEKAAFRRAAAAAGLRYGERFAFDTLFNGLSIRVDRTQIGTLSRIPGVKAIYPVDTVAAPEPPTPGEQADLATAIAMTGADIAQNELGYTGAGVKVAVMDTGIDVNHPDFGGDGVAELDSPAFTDHPRIRFGYDFVGNAFNADPASPAYNPVPAPDNNPDDCGGHGTHVAGIVGANGAVTGVAPGVTFGAYRVFGCAGSTTADIMIAAMERVLTDRMHVLNMSIGSAFQWPQYPTAQAADRLVNKGVVVVASIGNSGANGLYAAGAPGLGQKVIGVASFDNTQATQAAFAISPDDRLIGYNLATAAPPPPTAGTFPLARTGTPTSTSDACNALPANSLSGHIALIRRGTCGFHVKALNAMNAGAVGVVLYNNAPGALNPTVAGIPPITIPVVAITAADGGLINTRLDAGSVSLTWTTQTISTPVPTAGLISSFSSYGLSPDLTVKPDIGAPGGNIWSTYPLELGRYANLGGTSMAAPHVAGAAALLLEARPQTPAQAVRTILQNSADPKNWWGNPALGFLDNVHRQGAGMLDIDDAILATTTVEPAKLSLGESEMGPHTRSLTLKNKGAAAVTYALSHAPALSTGPNTFTPAFFTNSAGVAFSAPSVMVPAGGTATVDVTITAPAGLADLGQYGGYVVFTPQGGGQVYRVPYAGLKGDYQSKPVLVPTANGFPWLAQLSAGSYSNRPNGATFTMVGTDVPFILVHLDHQSRLFRVEVFGTDGKAWHRAVNEDYLGRNSTATSFFAFPFNGTTFGGGKVYTVPNGTYTMKVSVLKALGDAANPAHWETWTSPMFTIARP